MPSGIPIANGIESRSSALFSITRQNVGIVKLVCVGRGPDPRGRDAVPLRSSSGRPAWTIGIPSSADTSIAAGRHHQQIRRARGRRWSAVRRGRRRGGWRGALIADAGRCRELTSRTCWIKTALGRAPTCEEPRPNRITVLLVVEPFWSDGSCFQAFFICPSADPTRRSSRPARWEHLVAGVDDVALGDVVEHRVAG